LRDDIYKRCYGFYISDGLDWVKLVKEYPEERYENKEQMRGDFRRERDKRGDPSRDEYANNQKSEGDKTQQEQPPQKEQTSYKESDDSIHIICDSPRIRSKDDVIREFNINTKIWMVKDFTVKTSEGYRKDRSVEWEVSHGEVIRGEVHDSGKMLLVPMVHTETKFVRKGLDDIWDQEYIEELFSGIKEKQYLPLKIVPSQYSKNGKCLVVPIADLHLGLYATMKVNNNEYNMEIAEQLVMKTLSQIKERVAGMQFEEVVLVVGNDFLNSDNLSGTTTRGTPQDNDSFWYDMVDKAIEIIAITINSLLEIAPVRVYNVLSNHDLHSIYMIMQVVKAKFENNHNVEIDTSPLPRKYHVFGKNVIALSHDIRIGEGLKVVTTEAKKYWTDCSHFVFILAHLHKQMKYESQGHLELYRVPTISGYSRWSNDMTYIGIEKKTQCFIFDAEDGVIDTPFIVVR
jgi:hypothetical protein